MFSYVVHKNFFTQFDFNMTVRLQDHLPRRVDQPFSLLSTIGGAEVAGIFLLILLVFRRKLNGIFVIFFFGFFHLFEIFGKTFVKHLPPPHFMLRTHELFNMPQFYVREENSYPSGHTARAVFITTIIYLLMRNNKRLSKEQKLFVLGILVCYDITMGVSRIYLGEHWTSDVIGGAFLGLSFALLSGVFMYAQKNKQNPKLSE
jgi:undecaprenyl-diphosphatase